MPAVPQPVPATRKGTAPLKVYCLPEERVRIQLKAAAAGLSVSSYLLSVGQEYPIRGVLDYEKVRELARINGDLGRLGGLLKLWLTQDAHLEPFHPDAIRAVLRKIESHQSELGAVMRTVVGPQAGS